MPLKYLSLSLAFATIALTVVKAQAQTNTAAVWKKTVTRTIDIPEPEDDKKHHLQDVNAYNTLLEALVSSINAGKLTAYHNNDNMFSAKLSIQDINKMTADKMDTQLVVDPVTKEEMSVIRVIVFNPGFVHKYRIQEDWTFNPITGKTGIKITGIAPVRNVYGYDAGLRGVQTMFWVKYNEAVPVINKYEHNHPENTIANLVWQDYFMTDAHAQPAYVMRIIDMSQPEDTIQHHLHNAFPDSTLTEVIIAGIKTGKLPVYSRHDYKLQKRLSMGVINNLLVAKTDTQLIIDPINNTEKSVVRATETDFDQSHKYGILEKWDFDAATGKTNIQIIALALVAQVLDDGAASSAEQPALLLRYEDIKKITARYEQYNPASTLAQHIWNSYFHTDIKPSVVK